MITLILVVLWGVFWLMRKIGSSPVHEFTLQEIKRLELENKWLDAKNAAYLKHDKTWRN